MRIESFWARGFRSLRDVRIEPLGALNVFYGPNGSGKSNILAAIDAWLKLVPIALDIGDVNGPLVSGPNDHLLALARGHAAINEPHSPLRRHDLGLHPNTPRMTLGGRFEHAGHRIEIEIGVDVRVPGKPVLDRYVKVDDWTLGDVVQHGPAYDAKLRLLQSIAWERAFSLVSADRMPRTETPTDKPLERPPANSEPVSWYFRRGQLKDALFAAQNSDSAQTALALERFRRFMAGPPLHRRPFRVVENPSTGIRDVREWLGPPLEQPDISLDLAGLGIAQIYWILGQAMLSGANAIGIEEPEAHLHAPTTGRDLRRLLGRLVNENHIDQLFVATHSNLFDLDDTGFWDVRLENGETKVEKKPLDAIDVHLYEPGPTLHALEELLSFAPADKVMFRTADGAPVTAAEMRNRLRQADPIALDYLRNLHAAAVDVVGLRSRRGKTA